MKKSYIHNQLEDRLFLKKFRWCILLSLAILVSDVFSVLDMLDAEEPFFFPLVLGTTIVTSTLIFISLFITVKETNLGLKGYLRHEWEFTLGELPSIVQFLSLLTLVTVLMRDPYWRVTCTAILAVILFIYLNFKRKKYFEAFKKQIDKFHPFIIVQIEACTIILISGMIYGLASLITYAPKNI